MLDRVQRRVLADPAADLVIAGAQLPIHSIVSDGRKLLLFGQYLLSSNPDSEALAGIIGTYISKFSFHCSQSGKLSRRRPVSVEDGVALGDPSISRRGAEIDLLRLKPASAGVE